MFYQTCETQHDPQSPEKMKWRLLEGNKSWNGSHGPQLKNKPREVIRVKGMGDLIGRMGTGQNGRVWPVFRTGLGSNRGTGLTRDG